MRIALISPPYESVPPRLYGGTERVVYNLCRGLTDAGMEVTLFASGDSRAPGRLIPVTAEALRLRHKPVDDPAPFHVRMLREVGERAHEFDVIHNHNDFWMLPLSQMTRTPLVTTLHGRLDFPDTDQALLAYAHTRFLSISDSQRYPLPDLNWQRTIYHGIDLEGLQFRAEPGQYLAFLGRIHPDKRPDWAIEIAMRSGVPLKIAAKIEGEAGKRYYDRHVKPHVDGQFIQYVGEISEGEKSDFLGNALGLVFPIDWPEPFGLVVIEALACGTPVLARPCGAMPELLADGITGFVHPDLAVLAQRVTDLSQIDRGVCRAWVEERFSLSRMIKEHIDVYRGLLQSTPARRAARARLRPDRYRRDFLYSVERAADGNP